MAWKRRFDLTLQLMSGRSITLSVKKLQTLMWVSAHVDDTFDLHCTTYDLVHNDQLLICDEQSTLRDVGIYGPTTLSVVIQGPCPPRRYPR